MKNYDVVTAISLAVGGFCVLAIVLSAMQYFGSDEAAIANNRLPQWIACFVLCVLLYAVGSLAAKLQQIVYACDHVAKNTPEVNQPSDQARTASHTR